MSKIDCLMICYLIVTLLTSASAASSSSMINCLSEDELLLLIGFNPDVLSSINNTSNCNYSIPANNKEDTLNSKKEYYDFEVLNHNYSLDIGIYEDDLIHLQHFDDLFIEKLNIVKKSYYEVNDYNINYGNDLLNYLGNKHLLTNAISNAKLTYTESVNY